MNAMNKITILLALFFLTISSHSWAGVVVLDDAQAAKAEKQEKQRSEREAANLENNKDSKYRSDKDSKEAKKKNKSTDLLFGF